MKTKILFVGLDSLEPTLLERWTKSGDLPTLASLQDAGLTGTATNFAGFGNGLYWPCFFTGVNPGRHGRYFMYQIVTGSYEVSHFSDDTGLKCEPIWSVLGRGGKRVAVIDMFRAPLRRDFDGFQIAAWTDHSPGAPPRSWPPDLISQVIQRYGADPLGGDCDAYGPDPADYVRLHDELLRRIEMKTQMVCDHLAPGRWDLFMVNFAEAHDIGHRAWHLHDPAHALYDAAWVAAHGDPVKRIYCALDAAVARLLAAVGPGTTVIVLAGLGLEPDYTGNHLLEEILLCLESGPHAAPRQKLHPLAAGYRRIVPEGLRRGLRAAARRARIRIPISERSHRRFFAVPHDENSGAIRINLIGREPHGLVRPGAEYDSCCAELAKDLLAIRNLDGGAPIVREVVKVAEICEGPHMGDLPDLFAIWNRPRPISAVASPKIGALHRAYPGSRTGDHNERGVLIAHGPGIAAGRLSKPVRITALAPTIAALLGSALPQAEEAPLTQAFRTTVPL